MPPQSSTDTENTSGSTDAATESTWTFYGHWADDKLIVDDQLTVPGVVDDQRIDTGRWPQGLWAASAAGATIEEAQASVIAEYEDAGA